MCKLTSNVSPMLSGLDAAAFGPDDLDWVKSTGLQLTIPVRQAASLRLTRRWLAVSRTADGNFESCCNTNTSMSGPRTCGSKWYSFRF